MKRARPITTQRLYGMGFILVVLGLIGFINSTYVFMIIGPYLPRLEAVGVLAFHHIFFFNLCFTFYQCILTDPGVVPPNWGFYMGDETKRRRYCKMCNVWKPDRCHHCSICNRCILNMDHHCPWINNCVGFYNRKFFIQLLCYVYACLLIILVTSIPCLVARVQAASAMKSTNVRLIIQDCVVAFAYLLATMLIFTLTNFITFHFKLILDNYTTIENLEREEGAKSKFDIGRRRNWEQVFGSAQWLWWLPMHTSTSRPVGDGVRWRVHYTRVIDEDEELPADDASARTGGTGR